MSWSADGGGQDAGLPQRTIRFTPSFHQKGVSQLYYALVLLTVGLVAGALNFTGVSSVGVQISWILSLIGVLLVAIHVFKGRTTRIV